MTGGGMSYLSGKGSHGGFGPEVVLELLGDDPFVDIQVRNPVSVHI